MIRFSRRRCPFCGAEVEEEDGELVDLLGRPHTVDGKQSCAGAWENVT